MVSSGSVSYTHLDVYKRQTLTAILKAYSTGKFELPEEYRAELQEDAGHEKQA